MSMFDWAKEEVRLACELENPNRKEGEFDYGCACYESALKAFETLLSDVHSGYSIMITKNILNRLIDGKCLTPITDIPEVWNEVPSFRKEDGRRCYQCKRMFSLFKDVYPNGTIKYSDTDRCYGVDIGNENASYHSGLIDKVIDELYPITMPYIPNNKSIKVVCETFLYDPRNGDFDTRAIHYAIMPDEKRVHIGRYFAEIDGEFKEITRQEYHERYINRADHYRKSINETEEV